MFRKSGVFRVVGTGLACWLMPAGAAFSAHYLGHVAGGGLSQQEVDAFCNQYPALIKSPKFNEQDRPKYEQLYKQHCDPPVAKPGEPSGPAAPDEPGQQRPIRQGRIERIQPPACLAQGSEIHVRGEQLRDGHLNCRVEGGGERRSLQAYSRTAREYRFRLDHLQPGPDYVLQCEVAGDRARVMLRGCAEPGGPAQAGDVDLAAEIRAGTLRPGEAQMVEVLIPNRGQSRTPRNERYRVRLVLADRDLTRPAGKAMGSRGTLLEKEQWALRVPAGGQSERLSVAMNVPGSLAGSSGLHWCAWADSAGVIIETNKHNNLACVPASGGARTVVRDDLSKVFGSAVRGMGPGPLVPEPEASAGDPAGPFGTRQYIADEDAVRPSLVSDGSPPDLENFPAVQDRVANLPAVRDRVADLPAVQQEDDRQPALQRDPDLAVGDLGGRAGMIEQANQARGIREAAELARENLAVPGFEGGEQDPLSPGGFDIANRDTGNPLDNFRNYPDREDTEGPFGANPHMPEPTAPRNREGERPNAAKAAAMLIPSMNPRDWASGVASTGPEKEPGDKTTLVISPSANSTVHTVHDEETDATVTTTRYEGQATTRTTTTADGFGTVEILEEDPVAERWQENPWGNATNVIQEAYRAGHEVTAEENGSVRITFRNIDRMPRDDDHSSELAHWHAQFDHSKKEGPRVVDQVNPGPDGATPDPKGSRLKVPEHQLVGNPSVEALSGDARQARHSRERLLEEMRGPGGHPGDDDGDLEMPAN